MQFRRALPEKFNVLEVRSNQFTCESRNCRVLESLDERHRPFEIFQLVRRPGDGTLEILAQRIERLAPGVPFIGHKFLKNGDCSPFTIFYTVFNCAGDRWSMCKPSLLSQKLPDLQI